jgi:hypothetical protein
MEVINCSVSYELLAIIGPLKMNQFGIFMMLEILWMSLQSNATESLWSLVLYSSFSNSFGKVRFKTLYFMDKVFLCSLYSINVRISSVFVGSGVIRAERLAVDILSWRKNVKYTKGFLLKMSPT